ncbi:hypothetical protein TFLX_05501 [Thermoflexales bacterium]|nr:hypothetical protein TFLX_05501 [Thermoflexales bacterium]
MKSRFSQCFTVRFVRLITLGLALALLAALPRSGYSAPQATTRYVSPGGGDGNDCLTPDTPCEHIREAISRSASGDIVNIAAGTYVEDNLQIEDKSLTLQGQGAATTIIDGDGQERVLNLSDDDISSPMLIIVSGLRLQNGHSDSGGVINNETAVYLTIVDSEIVNGVATGAGGGGGIFNQGILKLINVVVRDNTANSGYGGGIYNLGHADLNGTTFRNNVAALGGGGIRNTNLMTITDSLIGPNNSSLGSGGGGIFNTDPDNRVTLVNSTIRDNEATASVGGGINNNGFLISSSTLITGNTATQDGGGIYNASSGQVTLSGGSLRGNSSTSTAGGGFFNGGSATLTSVVVTTNRAGTGGGGIHNAGNLFIDSNAITSNTAQGQPGGGINNQGILTLNRSTLAYNVALVSPGGGLRNSNSAYLTNVTISDNTAGSGSGIQNTGGTLTFQFSTISANSGAPAFNNASGSVIIGNSILSQTVGSVCGGSITSADYNLDSGTSCGFSQVHDLPSTNPQLGPLRNNGGDSLTRAIAFGSPAQDSAVTPCSPPTDQRGIIRPQLGSCDRGAYEVAGYTNPNPLDIPAGLCVTSTLTIDDQFAIGTLLAGVNLNYPNRTNLTIRLLSPGTNRVRLLGPAATSGQNLDTLFDDSAAQAVPAGDQNPASPFYDNTYKSAVPLQQFRGAGVKGNWKLEICNAGSSTGTLNRWVVVIPEVADFNVYMPMIRR